MLNTLQIFVPAVHYQFVVQIVKISVHQFIFQQSLTTLFWCFWVLNVSIIYHPVIICLISMLGNWTNWF